MSTYKLYATKTGEIPEGAEFSLRPCNTDYLLVFTDKELKKPCVEIPPETELTEQERQFVAHCKLVVNKRYLEQYATVYTPVLDEFCDRLEEELRAEKEKVSGGRTKKSKKK